MAQTQDNDIPTITVESSDFVPALIVIDMQNDFVSGSLAIPGATEIIPTVNALIELPFQIRVATRDFHPDNHVSFSNTHKRPSYTTVAIYHPDDLEELIGKEQTLWPVHCVADTSGAEFVPGLQRKFDAVVHKGTHPRIESYSAFRDIWARGETTLPALLKEAGITDIYICGLAGDYCVKYTAIDAVEYGYNTWVVEDAVKSVSPKEAAWDEMRRKGINVICYEDVKEKIGSDSKL